MKKVDLCDWINSDKNFKANADLFMGTTVQSMGDLKGYTVQMLFLGMAIPSKIARTNEEAKAMETAIWEAMK